MPGDIQKIIDSTPVIILFGGQGFDFYKIFDLVNINLWNKASDGLPYHSSA